MSDRLERWLEWYLRWSHRKGPFFFAALAAVIILPTGTFVESSLGISPIGGMILWSLVLTFSVFGAMGIVTRRALQDKCEKAEMPGERLVRWTGMRWETGDLFLKESGEIHHVQLPNLSNNGVSEISYTVSVSIPYENIIAETPIEITVHLTTDWRERELFRFAREYDSIETALREKINEQIHAKEGRSGIERAVRGFLAENRHSGRIRYEQLFRKIRKRLEVPNLELSNIHEVTVEVNSITLKWTEGSMMRHASATTG